VALQGKILKKMIKRLFDILFSFTALLILFPVLVCIYIAVLITMGRPVLFRQERPGLKGKSFFLYKFRTMTVPKAGEHSAKFDSVRTTSLGGIMRSLSLDELPTFINVLKGDMSIVGPRPLLVRYLERYSPEQARRHDVKPGITGWAQVNGRNAISWEEKFKFDVWYVDNYSFMLDMKILFMTVLKIIKREGVDHGEGLTMPEFMGGSETEE
jgi:lipopolysaccharide/colanic/teichoic acid biosynthesis glycosyltransferase